MHPGAENDTAMLRRLIEFFVYKTRGEITRIQLVKLIYLADLYAAKWTGQQLTHLSWYLYHFGPWEEGINDALRAMEGTTLLREERTSAQGEPLILFRPGPEARPIEEVERELPRSLRLTLENIRRRWAGAGAEHMQELLDYVYATAPMQAVLTHHERTERVPLNLLLERQHREDPHTALTR